MSGEEKLSNTVDAVAKLAKAVPIYDDAFKPIAIETGKALGTVGQAVNAALSPLRGMIWGMDQIEGWVQKAVTQKLQNISEEEISTPDPSIAGPLIEALRFNGQNPELSEMFACLLANSMARNSAKSTHPAFVDFIRTMTPFEARIVAALYSFPDMVVPSLNICRTVPDIGGKAMIYRHYSTPLVEKIEWVGSISPDYMHASIENLRRLQIVRESNSFESLMDPNYQESYEQMEKSDHLNPLREMAKDTQGQLVFDRGFIELTALGKNFCKATLTNPS